MAYGAMAGKAAGDTFDVTDYNQIDSNFQAGVPDIFTTKGDLAVATAANAASRLAVGANDSTLVAASGEATGIAWQIQPSCRVWNSALIDPATSTWVSLTFDNETAGNGCWDTDAMHSTASNTNRITIPANGDGLYLIGGTAEFDLSGRTSGTTDIGIRILKNGSGIWAEHFITEGHTSPGLDPVLSISALLSMVATDYAELQIYTSYDCNITSSAKYSPMFWAIWQRRV